MKKKDVINGMKVVPHDKSVYGDLKGSNSWKDALASNQNYLFVIEWDKSEKCFILSEIEDDEEGGDFFDAQDFEPYEVNEQDIIDKALNILITRGITPEEYEIMYWEMSEILPS